MNGWVEGRGDWTGGSPWLCPLFLNFNNNIKKIANVDEEKVKATISTTNLKLILQMKWLFSASDLIGSFIWYDMYLLVLRFFCSLACWMKFFSFLVFLYEIQSAVRMQNVIIKKVFVLSALFVGFILIFSFQTFSIAALFSR